MKGLSEKVAAGGFVGDLMLLGGVGISGYLSMQKLVENKQEIIHHYEVLEALNKTFEGLIDAESGRRGYLISKQKIHLETYSNGVQKANKTLKDLQRKVDGSSTQQRQLNELKLLVAKRLAILKRSISLLEKNQPNAAAQVNFTDQGWEAQQKIRASLQIINQEEQRLLQQRVAATDAIVRQTIIVVTVGSCLSLGLLLGVYFLLQKQIHIRSLTEAALQKREEEFRALVEKSPDSITHLNHQLQYLYVNPAAERKLGMPVNELVGKTRAELGFSAELTHHLESCWQKVLATGEIGMIEFEFSGSNNTPDKI